MTDVSLFWSQDKGSRALNRAFNLKAEKMEIIGLTMHFFEKKLGYMGGGGGGVMITSI